jgi:flagellar basal-body rod protein FlgF
VDAIAIAEIGMQNALQRMNSISQNLANVSTVGYKKAVAVTRPFDSFLVEQAARDAALPTVQTMVDPSAGTLRQTGNPLDLAVDGEGYFEVRNDTGVAYTRRGDLRLDPRGRLTTQQGYAVMGLGGELAVSGTSVSIDGKGEVRQGAHSIGQIKLVRFANPEALLPLGNGLFEQGGARLADKGVDGAIRVGYQENSNVNSAQEMVRLTETMRHFESMQKIVQGYDDLYEKAIRKLGEF